MTELLTRVLLHFDAEQFNYYIRFGRSHLRDDLDRRRAYEYFVAGQVFGYVRWEANEYGTRDWRFFILRAGGAFPPLHLVPGITPGAEVLVDIHGPARVYRLFELIDALEAQGIDPSDVAPWYYIQVNARLKCGLKALPYGQDQHRAWTLEKEALGS